MLNPDVVKVLTSLTEKGHLKWEQMAHGPPDKPLYLAKWFGYAIYTRAWGLQVLIDGVFLNIKLGNAQQMTKLNSAITEQQNQNPKRKGFDKSLDKYLEVK